MYEDYKDNGRGDEQGKSDYALKQLVGRCDDRVFATNNVTSGITFKKKVSSLLLRNCSTRVKKVNFLNN
jgi:hypothetical protein